MPLLPDVRKKGNPESQDTFFPQRLGRDVYEDISLTLKNRSLIDDLVSLVISGAETDPEEPPVNLEELANHLLVDGNLVIDTLDPAAPEFLSDAHAAKKGTWVQYARDGRTGSMFLRTRNNNVEWVYTEPMREYRLMDGPQGNGWYAWQLHFDARGKQREPTPTTMEEAYPEVELYAGDQEQLYVEEARYIVHPSHRGILYYAQHVYNRIEEIAMTMRRVGKGVNLLPIISGYTGPTSEAQAAMDTAVHAILFRGPISVDRVISDAVVRQLAMESQELSRDLTDALNVVEKDTPDRPVARDRELRMRVMLQFVKAVRRQMKAVLSRFGCKVNFAEIVVTSAQERGQEMDLLDRSRVELEQDMAGSYAKMKLKLVQG